MRIEDKNDGIGKGGLSELRMGIIGLGRVVVQL